MPVSPNPDSSASRPLQLLIALAVAALLVFTARQAADKLLPPQATRASPVTVTSAASLPAEATSAPLSEQALQTERARIDQEKQLIEQARLRREQKMQEAITARDQAEEIARLDQEHMDQAWGRFYKKPRKCDSANNPGIIVECSNHVLQERQRFEKLWAEGKFATR